jgi:hypothetical protein
MAIVPSDDYAGQITTGDGGYPEGKAKNVAVAGDGTGTPLEAAWVNDLWGWLQSLLARAGITPSGNPDEVGTSDYMDALDWMRVDERRVQTFDISVASQTGNDLNTEAGGTSGIRDISVGNHGYIWYKTSLTQAQRWICDNPYDLDSATIVGSTLTYDQGSNIESCAVALDGLKFYALASSDDTIYQYTLPSVWSFTGWSYSGKSLDITADSNPNKFCLDESGTYVFVWGANSETIYRYTLGTAWDLSTAGTVSANTLDTAALEQFIKGIHVSPDGTKLHAAYMSSDIPALSRVAEYRMATPFNLATATLRHTTTDLRTVPAEFSGETEDLSSLAGITFSEVGGRMYLGSTDDVDTIFELNSGFIGLP